MRGSPQEAQASRSVFLWGGGFCRLHLGGRGNEAVGPAGTEAPAPVSEEGWVTLGLPSEALTVAPRLLAMGPGIVPDASLRFQDPGRTWLWDLQRQLCV